MKKAKRLLVFILALALLTTPIYATQEAYLSSMTYEETLASSMKALGLFNGVSDFEFELDRAPTRTEALIMLIRLLGQEDAALAWSGSHPFTDIKGYKWAEGYIGYAYEKDITKGVGDTKFGGGETASAEMYLTFVLRALGYTEGEGGDFVWTSPFELAKSVGILPSGADTKNFLRGDVVLVSYAALSAKMKGSDKTLARSLVEKGVFTQKELDTYYDAAAIANGKLERSVYLEVEEYMLRLETSDGIDTVNNRVIYHSSIMQVNDAAFENYGFYEYGARCNAERIAKASEVLAGKARVFSIIAPNALGAMFSEEDFDKYTATTKTEKEGIAYAYSLSGENTICVDALTTLRAHNDEYIYFRTDHHWTALGAYYTYREWCRQAGFEPTDLETDYTALEQPGLFGMFYGWCGCPYAMTINPDNCIAYFPKNLDSISVSFMDFYGNEREGFLVKDYSNTAYQYGAFIGGDRPLTTITNNDIQDDSACVLIKGSYGNPFAVYLSQHYHTVYVVDYRYYYQVWGHLSLSRFADERGVDDVIFLVALTMSQADSTAQYLNNYCK